MGIFPYIGLIYGRYLQSIGSWNGHWNTLFLYCFFQVTIPTIIQQKKWFHPKSCRWMVIPSDLDKITHWLWWNTIWPFGRANAHWELTVSCKIGCSSMSLYNPLCSHSIFTFIISYNLKWISWSRKFAHLSSARWPQHHRFSSAWRCSGWTSNATSIWGWFRNPIYGQKIQNLVDNG